MEKKVLDVRLQMLSGTLEEWQNTNFTPAAGELIIVEEASLKEDGGTVEDIINEK